MESIIIPEGLTTIPERAFTGYTSLLTFEIPQSVTAIEALAFADCESLLTITIPENVTRFMSFPPFRGCASLQEINIATGNTFLKSINGVLFSADETILKRYPSGRDGTSYTVPGTVEIIHHHTFSQSRNLRSVGLPASLNYVDFEIFANSTYLDEISFAGNKPDFVSPDAFVDIASDARVTVGTFATGFETTISGLEIHRLPQLRFRGNQVIVEIDPSLGATPSLWHSFDLKEWSLVEEAARQDNVFTLPTATARLVGSQSFFKVLP